ncbi:MAG: hypothetical protein PHH37_02420 [Paludibacter sp.]|nr:hypothetical protein [Paludibacter sp.]
MFEAELSALKNKSLLYSWIRLALIICSIVLLILFFSAGHFFLYLIFSLSFLSSFIVIVYRHNLLEEKISILSSKLQVNRDEILFINYDFQNRKTGSEYEFMNPYLVNDFNLFGLGSLFQYINRCNTYFGKKLLAHNLCKPEKNISSIIAKQSAIDELKRKNDYIQNFQSYSRFILDNMNEFSFLKSWVNEPERFFKRKKNLAIILGAINIAWLFLSVFNLLTWSSFLIPILISQSVVVLQRNKTKKVHSNINVVPDILSKYVKLFELIEDEAFDAEYLVFLQKKLLVNETKASNSLNSLFRILFASELQNNVFISLLLNSLFLWDIHVKYYFTEWKKKYKNDIKDWFSAITEIEVLISFATFAFNNEENVTYPQLSRVFRIEALELGHPLISPNVRVNNDFFIDKPSIQIITGANMAGKSTFLRTLVTNLIIGMNGAPVVAQKFIFSPCDIMSSIKIQDSLVKNESYFYAELQRLKDIIEHVKTQPGTLVILDEILRGTNSNDKKTGSLGYLQKLIGLNSTVIIATHDLSICELANSYPGIAFNNCFEVELNNDQLFFDYKLKEGISSKLNASFLMKKMEIID